MSQTETGAGFGIPTNTGDDSHLAESSSEEFSLQLNTGELLAFLAMLGCVSMNGLDEAYLASMADDELRAAMDAGEASLQERGLITTDGDEEPTISDVLLALVGCSAIPEASLRLVCLQEGKRAVESYYDAVPELLVEHLVCEDGSHRFTRLPDGQSLRDRLSAHCQGLGGDDISAGDWECQIPSTTLAECLELCAAGDGEPAMRLLQASGCQPGVAGEIASALGSGLCCIGTVATGLRSPLTSTVDGAIVAALAGSRWLARTDGDDPAVTVVRSASGADCLGALVGLLAPLEAAMASSTANEGVGGDG